MTVKEYFGKNYAVPVNMTQYARYNKSVIVMTDKESFLADSYQLDAPLVTSEPRNILLYDALPFGSGSIVSKVIIPWSKVVVVMEYNT